MDWDMFFGKLLGTVFYVIGVAGMIGLPALAIYAIIRLAFGG